MLIRKEGEVLIQKGCLLTLRSRRISTNEPHDIHLADALYDILPTICLRELCYPRWRRSKYVHH